MASTHKIKTLAILSIETATGKAKALLEKVKQQLGFVPDMYGAMANEPALFESYATTYALFRAECGFTPIEQEVIFLVISAANGRNYCMAVHSFVADKMLKVPPEITDSVRDGRPISDTRLQGSRRFHESHARHARATLGRRRPKVSCRRLQREKYSRRHPWRQRQDSQQLCQSCLPHARRWRFRLARMEGGVTIRRRPAPLPSVVSPA